MPEDGFPEGVVTRTEIAELAALFDRFEFALDPRSLSAESEFESRVRRLFLERVAPGYASVGFGAFHCRIKTLCRAYLRKNLP